MFKDRKKVRGWALSLLVSLLPEGKKKSFLDTQQVSFSISYVQVLIVREAESKIQHLAPLVAKRLCQKQESQSHRNRIMVVARG